MFYVRQRDSGLVFFLFFFLLYTSRQYFSFIHKSRGSEATSFTLPLLSSWTQVLTVVIKNHTRGEGRGCSGRQGSRKDPKG